MTNVLYAAAKEAFLSGDIDLTADTIKAQLVDAADYTVNAATDTALDDIAAGARVATAITLGTKSVTGGVFDAADGTFTTATGDEAEALVIYKDTGVESTSTLIAYIDSATGLPVTPNGGNITVTWDSGSNKIFKL